jgi:DNA-directed RNA polymerase subunit RPC12/RpoP
MSEKMKCARCGKRFKQANKKQVFCADCLAKERVAKKSGAQLVSSPTGFASGAPFRSNQGMPSPSVTIVATTPPPEHGTYGSHARTAERHASPPPEHAPHPDAVAPSPRSSGPASPPVQSVPARQAPTKPAPAVEKRPKQPKPPAPSFQLTDELRANIEHRYLELSQPVEFDGIRSQIATELQAPKPVVKQVIRELRASRQLPSWWELQAYKGTDQTLERIRERYLPLLPVPPIGVHKQIASDLQLEAPQVYQAIRRLRAEMKLPQYNPPETHTDESHQPTQGGELTEAPSAPARPEETSSNHI